MFTNVGFGFFASVLLGLSAVTCGMLVFGGWRQRRHLLARVEASGPMPITRLPFGLIRTPFASSVLDVAAEARDALTQMAAEAARHLVQLEFAVQPDLSVHADRSALQAVLRELVGNAMRHAPGGRVLLSAIRLGGRVQIAVLDDGPGPDAAVQQAALREMAQVVALQGGTIDVEVSPGEGTTVLVRLPEPACAGRVTGEAATLLQTQQPTAPSPAAREVVAARSWDI